MKVKRRTQITLVKLLQDADAEYVSLVDHGANQAPFRLVKRALESIQLPPQADTGERRMKIKNLKAIAKSTTAAVAPPDKTKKATAILSMSLSKKQFKDEDAVRKYLDTTFDDYDVQEGKDFWKIANSVITEDDVDDVTDVVVAQGVIAKVGGLKKGTTTEQPKTDAKKDAKDAADPFKALLKKYDFWSAYMSGAQTVEEVMKAGLDSSPVPPGFGEVFDAMYIAMNNALIAGNTEQLGKICASGGEIIGKLSALFTALVGSKDEKAKKLAKKWAPEGEKKTVEAKLAKLRKEVIIDDTGEPAATADADKDKDEGKTDDAALQTFAKTVTDALESLSKTVGDKIDGVSAQVTEQKTALESLSERVGKLEEANPTTQQAHATDMEGFDRKGPAKKDASAENTREMIADRNIRSAFG